MANNTVRLITVSEDGSFRERDFDDVNDLLQMYEQIGIDDCSTDLGLRGMPIFRGLVGPIPEGGKVARYESPEVFETLTKEWSKTKTKRRRRRSSPQQAASGQVPAPRGIPSTGISLPTTASMVTS